MGTLVRIYIAMLTLGLAVIYKNYRDLSTPAPIPNINNNEYWGPGEGTDYIENTDVLPFDISVTPEFIADLKSQLNRPLKLHEPLEGIGFQYGFNSKELRNVVKYWREVYLSKWEKREAYLKKFSHFQTEIQGLKIHFLHVKPNNPKGKRVLPIIILHGWPGSVREFYELIPLLTMDSDKRDYVFEVIAPSLPGYGWSQGASKVNFGTIQIAVIMRNLMLRLGHEKFVVQGGDWGALIGSNLATLYPENVLALHSNMCSCYSPIAILKLLLASFFPTYFIEQEHTEFYKSFSETFKYFIQESGYFHIQATKPDTIGSALTDNPVGLAAYVLEKFSTWTNHTYINLSDGGLTRRFTLDALLDNVMIYYITNSITTSQRLYAEGFSKSQTKFNLDRVPIKIPTGCAHFKNELAHSPEFQLKEKYQNLVHNTHHKEGGHFPAFEIPQQLYNDLEIFLQKALK